MAWIPHDITRTELALMRALWRHGPSTVRELTDRLYPDGTHSQYATVQSLLGRLAKKGYVAGEKHGRINIFTAVLTRGELIGRQLRETAEDLCDGSLAPLLSHLVDAADLSEDELGALHKLVEKLDAQAGERKES